MPDVANETFERLIKLAMDASHRAYCPYSHFAVGASLLAADGQTFSGCNVENSSFGLTSCAERNAVFQMIAGGQQQILAVVVYTPTSHPVNLCGACRQVIHQFGARCRILSVCNGPQRIDTTLDKLLPNAFGSESIK